jgi:hypothetical protein
MKYVRTGTDAQELPELGLGTMPTLTDEMKTTTFDGSVREQSDRMSQCIEFGKRRRKCQRYHTDPPSSLTRLSFC